MQPLNYVAQALQHIQRGANTELEENARDLLVRWLTRAVSFQLPDEGRVLNDDLKGLHSVTLRKLPYPVTALSYKLSRTISFHSPVDVTRDTFARVDGEITLAADLYDEHVRQDLEELCESFVAHPDDMAKFRDTLANLTHGAILVNIARYRAMDIKTLQLKEPSVWAPSFDFTVLDNTDPDMESYITMPLRYQDRTATLLRQYEMMGFTAKTVPKHVHDSLVEAYEARGHSLAYYSVSAIHEFFEALTCKNVVTAAIQDEDRALSKRRIRKGKVPLLTEHILTIVAPRTVTVGSPRGGTHASPRQHLRRGHIRRLPKGNVWVQATVVGKAENGLIKKSYKVKAADR